MISLSASGGSVVFTFANSTYYLYGDGTITVPVNSLSLVIDNSNIATFKKAATNDIFVAAPVAEFGMSKAEIEAFYKENMVGSTGGGGGGIDSGTVQSMIDASISGKADTDDLTAYTLTSVTEALDGIVTGHTADTTVHVTSSEKSTWNAKSDFSGSYNDLTDKPTIPTVPTSNTAFTNDAGYATSGYVDSAVSGKQDTLVSGTNIKTINNESILGSGNITISGGSGSGNSVVECTQAEYDLMASGGTVDPTVFYIITDAPAVDLSGYVNTSAITSSVTSASTDSQIPTAKAVFDAIPTGGTGASYSAGRGINIDTGNTISVSLPISAGTGIKSIAEGGAQARGAYSHAEGQSTTASGNSSHAEGVLTQANGQFSHAEGDSAQANGQGSHAEGYSTKANGNNSHAEGTKTIANNYVEHASGMYNVSYTGSTDADKTLFSVGNGTAENARHNAFEIRQNGDIYISKDGSDIKLQDNLGGAASSAITSGDTNAVAGGAVYDKLDEVEQVTAAALNALNDNFGGLKLVKLTQQEYDALTTKDSNTLYIIASAPFAGKWLATYTGGTTDSAACDSTSAITSGEITLTDLENLVIGDCVDSIDMWAFDGANSLTSVTISDSVTSISNYAFQNCVGLTDVTIGSGVTSIGEGAFNSTNGSFTLTIHATTPPTLTNDIFSEPNGGIFVPAEAVQDYQNANIWSNYAQEIQPIQ